MPGGNQTRVFQFLPWGLSEQPEQLHIFFLLFLQMYAVTVAGNLRILATGTDACVHVPMCFFLTSLSCADILFTSTTVPQTLVNIQTQSRSISYVGCLVQLYFLTLGDMDIFLLVTMAFEYFVVICHPLHYTMVTAAPQCCTFSAAVSACVLKTSLVAMTYTFLIFCISFCSTSSLTVL